MKLNIIEILAKAEKAQENPETAELGKLIRYLLESIYPGQIRPKKFCCYCGEEDEEYNLYDYHNDGGGISVMHGNCHFEMLNKFVIR